VWSVGTEPRTSGLVSATHICHLQWAQVDGPLTTEIQIGADAREHDLQACEAPRPGAARLGLWLTYSYCIVIAPSDFCQETGAPCLRYFVVCVDLSTK
jgi:hypothetical protein